MDRYAKQLLLGSVAGLAGAVILDGFRKGVQKFFRSAEPPIRQHPGKFMIHQAEQMLPGKTRIAVRHHVRGKSETALANALGAGYGAFFGSLYAMTRPRTEKAVRDGVVLGLATWAAGYLGWLPATGLMPPIWKHSPKQIATPLVEHALYGIATTASLSWLEKHFVNRPASAEGP